MTVRTEGDRQRALAADHEAEAGRALRRAAAHDRGDVGERVVRDLLEPLAVEGWILLHHRHWPDTRRADLDHLLVGPGGVVVLDTKNWHTSVRLASGRLLQGQDDVTAEADGLLAQIGAIEDVVAGEGLAPLQVTGALVFVGQDLVPACLGRAVLLDERHLLRWLQSLGQRLEPEAVQALGAALAVAAPPFRQSPAVVPVVLPRARPRTPEPSLSLFDVEDLDLAELERASRLTLEQWMVYLHPAQLDAVGTAQASVDSCL